MSLYYTADLERRRTRRAAVGLLVFWTFCALVAWLVDDRPDTTDAVPPAAVFGLAAPAPPGAALVFASLTLPPTVDGPSGLADGGEDRQAAVTIRDRGITRAAGGVAPAGSSVPTVVQASGGLALMVPALGTAEISLPAVPHHTVWDDLAACESHGEWDYDPATATWGSRIYSGGLQFLPSTWSAFAPDGFPTHAHDASRVQQIAVAERVLEVQGWKAWPTCARKLGLL